MLRLIGEKEFFATISDSRSSWPKYRHVVRWKKSLFGAGRASGLRGVTCSRVSAEGVRAVFFYVEVTTALLNKITELFDNGKLVMDVGTVLPLEEARVAREMLGGVPHKRGKDRTEDGRLSVEIGTACKASHAFAAKGRYRSESFGKNRSRTRILGNVILTTEQSTKGQHLSCSIYDPRSLSNPY